VKVTLGRPLNLPLVIFVPRARCPQDVQRLDKDRSIDRSIRLPFRSRNILHACGGRIDQPRARVRLALRARDSTNFIRARRHGECFSDAAFDSAATEFAGNYARESSYRAGVIAAAVIDGLKFGIEISRPLIVHQSRA
jgi:hypothetical protein